MSTGAQSQQIESRRLAAQQQVDLLIKKLAQLADQDLAPADFYGPFLQNVLQTLAAPAGVVWERSAQGNLMLQYHVNLQLAGLEDEERRRTHDDLLRRALTQGRPMHVLPHSRAGAGENGEVGGGNPTDYLLLLAPMKVDEEVVGMLEVWQRPNFQPANALEGFMRFLLAMAEIASIYIRNRQRRRMVGQEQLWQQMEAFDLQVQASLNTTEVSYLVANEGRRLIDCDRVSIGVRYGKKVSIQAVSGVDIVERRSKQVRRLQLLCRRVLEWGEKLVFRGVPDESIPPKVVEALDAYLEESTSKLLIVAPLKDPREEESKKPARSVIVMEAFDPPAAPEQMLGRLEVVGKHATRALYNATEYQRIPMRWMWTPIAKAQEGLGGKARAIGIAVAAGLLLLIAAMIWVPYPLKMDAQGQLLPVNRSWVFPQAEGRVVQIADNIRPGTYVHHDQRLIEMYDYDLDKRMKEVKQAIEQAQNKILNLDGELALAQQQIDQRRITMERDEAVTIRDSRTKQLNDLVEKMGADPSHDGYFWVTAPQDGSILNADFRETLTNRDVKASEPLLRIGKLDQRWELKLQIPQKHIGQVWRAFPADPKAELDVDLLVLSQPTRTFKAKLSRDKIGREANVNRDEGSNDAEPLVTAWVRIDGDGIPEKDQLPRDLLKAAGTEVHAKIRCGDHALGYSLFYGVWEFFYEKIVFFF